MSEKPKLNKQGLLKAYRIFRFIRPYRWSFILGMLCLVISSSMFMIFPAAAGEMANTAIGKGKWSLDVGDFGLLFLVILVIQGLLSYFRTIYFARVSEYGIADVRKALYQKLISQDLVFFESQRVGELTSRLTADVEQLQNAFSITLAEFIRQIVILVLGVFIIAYLAPHLSLIMLLTFPVIVVSSVLFGKYIRTLSKKRQDALAETNIIVEESFQAFSIVKAFTNELYETKRFGKSIEQMVGISMNYARMRGLFFIFIITVLFGGLFFILWRGALLVQSGEMEAGDLFSFIIYTGIIGGAIAGIGNLYSTLAGSIGATERIQDILDRNDEIDIDQYQEDHYIKLEGKVEFKNVHFSYPSRNDVKVLNDISFVVNKGERIALVGQSGAGKSTIAQLVMRFYDTNQGEILVDGKNVHEYDLWSFRRNIAIVPQDVILFGGTIRENIMYGKPEASESELLDAAEKSNSIEFIQGFPDGFDTVVGERGIKLSGGQKQRIAIARAILRDPSILILDEATSSLDSESEKLVQDALEKLMRNRTSIIIAHRLSTIRDADRIYVLKDGKIAESGNHQLLINIQDGIYKNLVNLQMDSSQIHAN
ncbi:MAG: ATP-binding cassette domain-containing protein [Saprospiraceae bacterium]|nr:ATP-binding cassette domain-containing protein [Saprospiraceae bacterium]MBK9631273.1 ATP-binding cassette domain-containing protein [Saprospiraceae bacterium]